MKNRLLSKIVFLLIVVSCHLQLVGCETPWKFIGAEKVIRVLTKEMPDLLNQSIKLEHSLQGRFIDIFVNNKKRIEVKCWKNFYAGTFITQFRKDLQEIDNLNDLLWIFDSKMDFVLKDKVIAALSSPAGRAELKKIPASKANQLLNRGDLDDDFPELIADAFINFFNENQNFIKHIVTK